VTLPCHDTIVTMVIRHWLPWLLDIGYHGYFKHWLPITMFVFNFGIFEGFIIYSPNVSGRGCGIKDFLNLNCFLLHLEESMVKSEGHVTVRNVNYSAQDRLTSTFKS